MKRPRMLSWALLFGLSSANILRNHLPSGSSFGVAGEDAVYDYVIVGAGTAGLPLATRLAQDGRYSVAVIEGGSFYEIDNGNRSVIPGYDFHSSGLSMEGVNLLIDWGFETTPQTGADDKAVHYARGKCLGGSSARNYMVYNRPTKGTMRKWADSVGDDSWTWENVFPYFKKSATFTPPNMKVRAANATPYYDAGVFGDGPLQVSYPHYGFPVSSWIGRAFEEGGDPPRKEGMQNGELLGHGYLPATLDPVNQERSSSQTSYGRLALEKTDLTFYTRSLVKKILFTDKIATGVSVEAEGTTYTISARKEVIVSAGAFQSPQLLMVSGIGPADILRKNKIPVISALPGVGQNMQDNPLFGISFAVNVETMMTYLVNPTRMAEAISDYNNQKTGFLTSSGADVISFQKLATMPGVNLSTNAKEALSDIPEDYPDVMIWSFATWLGPSLGSFPPDMRAYGSFVISLVATKSRGTVSINSADMADKPIINPNWMTDPTDEELAVAAMRRAREFLNTKAMKNILVDGESYPGPDVTSYEDLLAVVKKQTAPFSHASATCKMGKADDHMAVVDSQGRVFGVQNLRVVDLSAIPFLPPGQPQATLYMMAEKIADEILRSSDNDSVNRESHGHDEL